MTAIDRRSGADPLLDANLEPVLPRERSVDRRRIVDRLIARDAPPVCTLFAPAGYGKTTVLGQWVTRETRPVAWHTIDERDNEPGVFLSYLATALGRIGPVDQRLLRINASTSERVLASIVPRLLNDIHRWDRPGVLVLDDAHRLVDRRSLDALATITDHLPAGFRVALAGREPPDLPLARLRAERRLLELDRAALALDAAETAALAESAGWRLEPDEVAELLARTEGWAAGIYLAAIAHHPGETGPEWVRSVTGGSGHIADYLRAELARRFTDDEQRLLTRTSILDTVSPRIAEVLSGIPGAAAMLDDLVSRGLLVDALGVRHRRYRYHKLLRDFLLSELDRREPGARPSLHRLAAATLAEEGDFDAAVHNLIATGAVDEAATLVASNAVTAFQGGSIVMVHRWLGAFDVAAFERHPRLAVIGAWVAMLTGEGDLAARLASVVERAPDDGTADAPSAFMVERALLRALRCRRGVEDMRQTADYAVDHLPVGSPWYTHALWIKGSGAALAGDFERADELLEASVSHAHVTRAPSTAPLCKRAALAMRRGMWPSAARLAADAAERMTEHGYEGLASALFVYAVQARVAAHAGDTAGARALLVRAQIVRPLATPFAPWFCVDALTELARAYLAVADPAGAQTVIHEAAAIASRVPDLGTVSQDLEAVRELALTSAATLAGSSALTSAELRVLAFLPTYLSFPEIAERLVLSRNTVKTHAMAIYGKLWASSRSEAVERAVELGLLEPYPGLPPAAEPGDGRARGASGR